MSFTEVKWGNILNQQEMKKEIVLNIWEKGTNIEIRQRSSNTQIMSPWKENQSKRKEQILKTLTRENLPKCSEIEITYGKNILHTWKYQPKIIRRIQDILIKLLFFEERDKDPLIIWAKILLLITDMENKLDCYQVFQE